MGSGSSTTETSEENNIIEQLQKNVDELISFMADKHDTMEIQNVDFVVKKKCDFERDKQRLKQLKGELQQLGVCLGELRDVVKSKKALEESCAHLRVEHEDLDKKNRSLKEELANTSKDDSTMGNGTSTDSTSGTTSDKLTLEKSNIETHLKQLKTLEKRVKEKVSIKNSNSNTIHSLTTKTAELEKDRMNLQSELENYRSLPTLLHILDLYKKLQCFRKDINKINNDRSIELQSKDLAMKITSKQVENLKLEKDMKQKLSFEMKNEQQLQQLIQAEKELEVTRSDSRNFSHCKKQTLDDLRIKIKKSLNQFDNISNTVNVIEQEVEAYKEELVALQNNSTVIKNREEIQSKKILNILNKQDVAMRGFLQLPRPIDDRYLRNKRYAIMLINLAEKDDTSDRQRVLEIISFLCNVSPEEIEIQRLGKYNSNKARPIKVYVPTFKIVSAILSNGQALQEGKYQDVRVTAYKKRNRAGGKDSVATSDKYQKSELSDK